MAHISEEQIRGVLADVLNDHANKAELSNEDINSILNQTVQALGMNKMVLPEQSDAVIAAVGADKLHHKDQDALV